jgi:hypothetical protein
MIAVIGSPKVVALGWMFILVPAVAGSVILVIVATLLNNMASDRSYPMSWLGRPPPPLPPKPKDSDDSFSRGITNDAAITPSSPLLGEKLKLEQTKV